MRIRDPGHLGLLWGISALFFILWWVAEGLGQFAGIPGEGWLAIAVFYLPVPLLATWIWFGRGNEALRWASRGRELPRKYPDAAGPHKDSQS